MDTTLTIPNETEYCTQVTYYGTKEMTQTSEAQSSTTYSELYVQLNEAMQKHTLQTQEQHSQTQPLPHQDAGKIQLFKHYAVVFGCFSIACGMIGMILIIVLATGYIIPYSKVQGFLLGNCTTIALALIQNYTSCSCSGKNCRYVKSLRHYIFSSSPLSPSSYSSLFLYFFSFVFFFFFSSFFFLVFMFLFLFFLFLYFYIFFFGFYSSSPSLLFLLLHFRILCSFLFTPILFYFFHFVFVFSP